MEKFIESDASRQNEILEEIGSSIRGIRKEIGWVPFGIAVLSLIGIRSCYHNSRIANSLEKQEKPEIQTRDVIGNSEPERFYEFNGQRVYLEIDGKPVESYFAQKPIPGGIR